MKTKKMTQAQAFETVYKDLAAWMYGNDHDGSLEFAFNNDYQIHAVNQWLGTGAASETPEMNEAVSVLKISRIQEEAEITALLKQAFIYECPDCNHHGYYDSDEGESIKCMSCNKTAYRQAKAEDVVEAAQELFPEATVLPYGPSKLKAVYVHNEDDSAGFRIIVAPYSVAMDRQGIHLTEVTVDELQARLMDAAETAQRDMFETIWVHVISA